MIKPNRNKTPARVHLLRAKFYGMQKYLRCMLSVRSMLDIWIIVIDHLTYAIKIVMLVIHLTSQYLKQWSSFIGACMGQSASMS